MKYNPGLHALLTITNVKAKKLCCLEDWIFFVDSQIIQHSLVNLGSIKHSFNETKGFTAVHCLTESHISIHTWPEFNLCTCDIFLSNFLNDNSQKVKAITRSIIEYFESDKYQLTELNR